MTNLPKFSHVQVGSVSVQYATQKSRNSHDLGCASKRFFRSLSRSTIYLRISKDEFPSPISLGGRAVGWLELDVNAWLAEKVEASRSAK